MAQKRVVRGAIVLSLILSGAYLCTSGTATCGSVAGTSAMSAIDFCFMFDCTNGALGGLVDPCADVGEVDDTGGSTGEGTGVLGGPFFTDCNALEEDE